jgi:hypothetical protein
VVTQYDVQIFTQGDGDRGCARQVKTPRATSADGVFSVGVDQNGSSSPGSMKNLGWS